MKLGIDLLGAGAYPHPEEIVAALPQGIGIGFFWHAPGWPTAQRFANLLFASGKCSGSFVRAHLADWEDDHTPEHNDLAVAVTNAYLFEAIARAHPEVRCYGGTLCEHKMNRADAEAWMRAIGNAAPHCTIINAPMSGAKIGGVLNETHWLGARPSKRYGWSMDGHSCLPGGAQRYIKKFPGAEYGLLWDCSCNGKRSDKDKTKRPDRRAYPDARKIQKIWASRNR